MGLADNDPGYWCLALGPQERLSLAQGRLFAEYDDLLHYLAESGLQEAVNRQEVTLLFWRGTPTSTDPFLSLLRPEQMPLASPPAA